MAKFVLIFLFLSSYAQADFLGFSGSKDALQSKIPALTEKLKALNMISDPSYEDSFNQVVKAIENTVEEEKLFCSGEAADEKGRTLSKDQKQLCFRELKTHYVSGVGLIFEMKKKYLELIHKKHIERLIEIQDQMKKDIEKNF